MSSGAPDFRFFDFSHPGGFSPVPQDCVPRDDAERQIVYECFQTTSATVGVRKIRVHPAPVVAVAVAAVVALYAKSQRLAGELLAVEINLTGKCGIPMRRAGKADPA